MCFLLVVSIDAPFDIRSIWFCEIRAKPQNNTPHLKAMELSDFQHFGHITTIDYKY